MIKQLVLVGYQFMYDLRYQASQGLLGNYCYEIDFLDWVKNGAVYNTYENNAQLRIDSFMRTLHLLQTDKACTGDDFLKLRNMVVLFYTDLLELYQSNFKSFSEFGIKLGLDSKKVKSRTDMCLLENIHAVIRPSFKLVKARLHSVGFVDEVVNSKGYVSEHNDEILACLSYAGAVNYTDVYEHFSILYDHSTKANYNKNILLEVVSC